MINTKLKQNQTIGKTLLTGVLLFLLLSLVGFLVTNPLTNAKAKCWTDYALNTTYCIYSGSQGADVPEDEISHR